MNEEEVKYMLTPKGFLYSKLIKYGLNDTEIDNIWHMLEAFAFKNIKIQYPDAHYAAIIFDGNGGEVIGLDYQGQ